MDFPTLTTALMSGVNAVSGCAIAQDAAQMQTQLRARLASAFTESDTSTVRGLSVQGSVDGKLYVAFFTWAEDVVAPDLDIEIPTDEARVTCRSSAQDRVSLFAAQREIVEDINAEIALAPVGSTGLVYEVQVSLSGAGGMVLITVLWRLAPPPPPP